MKDYRETLLAEKKETLKSLCPENDNYDKTLEDIKWLEKSIAQDKEEKRFEKSFSNVKESLYSSINHIYGNDFLSFSSVELLDDKAFISSEKDIIDIIINLNITIGHGFCMKNVYRCLRDGYFVQIYENTESEYKNKFLINYFDLISEKKEISKKQRIYYIQAAQSKTLYEKILAEIKNIPKVDLPHYIDSDIDEKITDNHLSIMLHGQSLKTELARHKQDFENYKKLGDRFIDNSENHNENEDPDREFTTEEIDKIYQSLSQG